MTATHNLMPLDVAQSLQTATRHAYAILFSALKESSPDSSIHTAQKLVLGVVHQTLQDCAREHSVVAPVAARMPTELLAEVFALLPLSERIATSHVCHAWRAASLAYPHRVWSVIESTNHWQPDLLAAILERAGNVPVAIRHVDYHRQGRAAFAQLIKKHLYHIHTLYVEFSPQYSGWWKVWDSVLGAPAPLLESLTLNISDTEVPHFALPKPLFAGKAPRLRVLRLLNGSYSPSSLEGLSALEHFTVSEDTIYLHSILLVLQTLTSIKTLRIEGYGGINTEVNGLLNTASPIYPPHNLEKLYVHTEAVHLADIEFLISAIDCTRIPVIHWWMDLDLYLGTNNVATLLCKTPIQSIAFKTHDNGFGMRLVDSIGSIRIFLVALVTSGLMQHFAPVMPAVTELTLVDSLMDIPPQALDTLSTITSLTIVEDVKVLQEHEWGRLWADTTLRPIETIRIMATSSSDQQDPSEPLAPSVFTPVVHRFAQNGCKINLVEIYGATSTVIGDAFCDLAKEVKIHSEPLEIPWEDEAPW